MEELIIYSVLLLLVFAHLLFANKLYKAIQKDKHLSFHEKNDWKLKALVFPAYYWFKYKELKR